MFISLEQVLLTKDVLWCSLCKLYDRKTHTEISLESTIVSDISLMCRFYSLQNAALTLCAGQFQASVFLKQILHSSC